MRVTTYERKANYYETDQMGIIHHSNYIRWFEEARVDFMEKIGFGYQQAVAHGIDFALTGLSCEYKSPTRFADTVLIRVWISQYSASRLAMSYEIIDPKSGEIRCTGETRHCYFDNAKQRPVSLPKALPELHAIIQALLAETE